jgi:hypothetical protein
VLLRRNGLWFWKNPLFFLRTCFSGDPAGGADCLTGDVIPLGGSILEKDVGLEYSLRESLLEGRAEVMAELRSEGGPVRQSMVIPSIGYGSWGTAEKSCCWCWLTS